MKAITGIQQLESRGDKKKTLDGYKSNKDFANVLNIFYTHFETCESKNVIQDLQGQACKWAKGGRSQGPDNICGRLPKNSAKQPSPIYRSFLSNSLLD